jgi:hypothetical protein
VALHFLACANCKLRSAGATGAEEFPRYIFPDRVLDLRKFQHNVVRDIASERAMIFGGATPIKLENLGWSRWRNAINKTTRAI